MAEVVLQKVFKLYGEVAVIDVAIEVERMHVFDAEAELPDRVRE